SMSRANTNTSQSSNNSFKELQIQIEEFRQKRDDLNKRTKEFINKLQEIDVKIEEYLILAKNDYKKKRDYWNSKVKNLKDKKIEYKNILDKFIEEKKNILKESKKGSGPKKYVSIKQIEKKIENLERRIEIENLNILEENAMVDKIRELAQIKQEFLAGQQNSDFFKIDRKIQIVKINLNKIYEQLDKWSSKSQDYHAKMHDIYQTINELRGKKKTLEEELIENKKAADAYHEKFLRVMSKIKKDSKGKRPTYATRKPRVSKRQNTFRNEELEKLKQDKLAVALEKQKSGRKLNLYEARLILERPKE
ncbi:MAG: hypothetical protein KGD61_03565, partial [Candidatus Lokiarchaeota archaeon]|nr:hypothetical protein [Candidatus Lokiarchaeota archaeon]